MSIAIASASSRFSSALSGRRPRSPRGEKRRCPAVSCRVLLALTSVFVAKRSRDASARRPRYFANTTARLAGTKERVASSRLAAQVSGDGALRLDEAIYHRCEDRANGPAAAVCVPACVHCYGQQQRCHRCVYG